MQLRLVAGADRGAVHAAQWDVVLGRGAFKTVYKGFDEEEGIEVAWNRVRVSELVQSKEERDRLFAEIRVLKQLKHKNIMTFYDSWLDSKCAPAWFSAALPALAAALRLSSQGAVLTRARVLQAWVRQLHHGAVHVRDAAPVRPSASTCIRPVPTSLPSAGVAAVVAVAPRTLSCFHSLFSVTWFHVLDG